MAAICVSLLQESIIIVFDIYHILILEAIGTERATSLVNGCPRDPAILDFVTNI